MTDITISASAEQMQTSYTIFAGWVLPTLGGILVLLGVLIAAIGFLCLWMAIPMVRA